MGALGNQLVQMAIEESNRLRQRKHELNKEKADLETKAAKLQEALRQTDFAIDRLGDFQAILGNIPQCPVCWIRHGAHAALIPQPSGTEIDLFRCRECHFELELDP